MNYIKQLVGEVAEQKDKLEMAMQAINAIEGYLLSSKFHCGDALDGYVSTNDILNRLELVKEEIR